MAGGTKWGDGSRLSNDRIAAPNTTLVTWRSIGRERVAEREAATRLCAVCGAKALYRVYHRGAVNVGACAAHKSEVVAKSSLFRGY
jgi:hypothetical protein